MDKGAKAAASTTNEEYQVLAEMEIVKAHPNNTSKKSVTEEVCT